MTRADPASPLWLVDWSDREDDDFRDAWAACRIDARVLRAPSLGTTVGRPWHRARSWPSYLGLAACGLLRARGAPLVAWQPAAGALGALLRPGHRPPLVVLNPLVSSSTDQGSLGRVLLSGIRRSDQVVFFSRGSLPVAAGLGVPSSRTSFVPLGAPARCQVPAPPGEFLLAAGRDHRDWPTLAVACRNLDFEVLAVGTPRIPGPPNLRFVPGVGRAGFLSLVERSRGVVVPLRPGDRPAGQLAILDAMSMGRAVVATRTVGTEDYVTHDTGRLVTPSDPEELRSAMEELLCPDLARSLGQSALERVRGPQSLRTFVGEIHRIATQAT